MEAIVRKARNKEAITAGFLTFLLLLNLNGALAASGGRMGGSDFSDSSDSSSPSSYSSSYSSPTYSEDGMLSTDDDEPTTHRKRELNARRPPPPAERESKGESEPSSGICYIMILIAGSVWFHVFLSAKKRSTSVIKLQVGLLGSARSFQKELDRIAETADTSTSRGWNHILKETTSALLQHSDSFISAHSSVYVKPSIKDGKNHFNKLSIEERGKFDEESLVNVNSIKIQNTTSTESLGFSNEYIVVTILVVAEGVHELPEIGSISDLKGVLQKLTSIPPSKTRAVEVLWTPQKENETLSEQKYREDYPLLRSL